MVWVSVGAVGGILAYRKLEELVNESMSKGLVLTLMDAGTSARVFAAGVGEQVSKIRQSNQTTQQNSIIP
jgi:uncharacterized caspase-like protein